MTDQHPVIPGLPTIWDPSAGETGNWRPKHNIDTREEHDHGPPAGHVHDGGDKPHWHPDGDDLHAPDLTYAERLEIARAIEVAREAIDRARVAAPTARSFYVRDVYPPLVDHDRIARDVFPDVEDRIVPPPDGHGPPEPIILGEDGEYVVMYGHVDQRLAVCLAVTTLASVWGVEGAIEIAFTADDSGGPDAEDLVGLLRSTQHVTARQWRDTRNYESVVWWADPNEIYPERFEPVGDPFPATVVSLDV